MPVRMLTNSPVQRDNVGIFQIKCTLLGFLRKSGHYSNDATDWLYNNPSCLLDGSSAMRWFQQQTRYDNFPKCVTLHCYTCVIIIIQYCNKILSPILFYLFIIIINYFKKVLKKLGNYLLLILCLPIDFKIP